MVRYIFDKEKGIIPVFAVLNDERIISMALDTGATFCLISKDFAKALNIDIANPEKKIKMMTAEGRCEVPLINLKSIFVMEKTATNIKTVIHDLPENSRVDGLLGLSFLKHFRLTVDFRNGYLELE